VSYRTTRHNGLVADTSRPESHASIAVVGSALSTSAWRTWAGLGLRRLAGVIHVHPTLASQAPWRKKESA
jgi:hypothetical protein